MQGAAFQGTRHQLANGVGGKYLSICSSSSKLSIAVRESNLKDHLPKKGILWLGMIPSFCCLPARRRLTSFGDKASGCLVIGDQYIDELSFQGSTDRFEFFRATSHTNHMIDSLDFGES